MGVPIQGLGDKEKEWYAQVVVSAILADGEVSLPEIDFLKQVIALISVPKTKKSLMAQIGFKKAKLLEAPPTTINKDILSAIFLELILLMISDLDFDEGEKLFLKEVKDLMGISQASFKELMGWARDGLNWKIQKSEFIKEKALAGGLPINELSSDQKKWYGEVLISTILLDGSIDEMERELLKLALSLIESPQDRMKMVGYIKNKIKIPLEMPPECSEDILTQMFLEVLNLIMSSENISYGEQTYLRNLADFCDFPEEKFKKMMQWAMDGIDWQKGKNRLINNIRFES